MTSPPAWTPRADPAPPAADPVPGHQSGRTGRAARLRPPRGSGRGAALFGTGVLAALLAMFGYTTLQAGPPPLDLGQVDQAIASALASVTPGPPLSELAYAAIRPSLVLVQASPAAGSPSSGPSPSGSDAPSGTDAPSGSLGSGVVIDDAGDIMTSLHVVEGATSIQVTFADGSTSPATITSSSPDTDTAVLQASQPPQGLQPAVLGNPGAMHIGSQAFVVGNPFGLYASMSSGVVSGLDRSFTLASGRQLSGLIQVDAAVNPGNSGGPLLDRNGRVVGIVTALINPTQEDVFVGIGLAVPINVAGGAAGLPQY